MCAVHLKFLDNLSLILSQDFLFISFRILLYLNFHILPKTVHLYLIILPHSRTLSSILFLLLFPPYYFFPPSLHSRHYLLFLYSYPSMFSLSLTPFFSLYRKTIIILLLFLFFISYIHSIPHIYFSPSLPFYLGSFYNIFLSFFNFSLSIYLFNFFLIHQHYPSLFLVFKFPHYISSSLYFFSPYHLP